MMKNKWLVGLVLTILLVSIVLVGCAAQPTEPAEPGEPAVKDPFVIGITAAMTGRGAVTYLPPADGVRIYMETINDEGGINGHEVEVKIEDNQGEPPVAVSTTKKLISEGSNLILVSGIFGRTFFSPEQYVQQGPHQPPVNIPTKK